MTQLPIEVTVYNNEKELVEIVQTFEPTPNFPWKENDAMKPYTQRYKRQNMKLINYKNLHFNLFADENYEIVKMLVPEKSHPHNAEKGETRNEIIFEVIDFPERLKMAEK